MSRLFNSVRGPICKDGPTCLLIRLLLVVAGLGVLAIGLFQLPSTAMTHGEMIVGLLLSFAVAAQILFAALFLPTNARHTS